MKKIKGPVDTVEVLMAVEPYLYRHDEDDRYLYIDFTHCVMRIPEQILSKEGEFRDVQLAKYVSRLANRMSLKLLGIVEDLEKGIRRFPIHGAPDRH